MIRYDLKADYDRREYTVVERDTGRVVATYRYKARSESARAYACGRAHLHQHELNRKQPK
jgi:hypothetical protein